VYLVYNVIEEYHSGAKSEALLQEETWQNNVISGNMKTYTSLFEGRHVDDTYGLGILRHDWGIGCFIVGSRMQSGWKPGTGSRRRGTAFCRGGRD